MFGKLLRDSGISRYSESIPQIYTRVIPFSGEQDLTFGMKRQFCSQYWGQPLEYVQVTSLDSEYGFPQFINAKDEYNKFIAWKELFYKLGTRSNDHELKRKIYQTDSNTSSLSEVAYAAENYPAVNQKVLGRVLGRVQDGYAVGIGGLVAFLPAVEVPLGTRFQQTDFMARKVLLVTVKHATTHNSQLNEPYIVVSLK